MNFLDTIDYFEEIKQEILAIKADPVSAWTYDDVKLKVDFCNYVMDQLSEYGSKKGFKVELPDNFMPNNIRCATDMGMQAFININLQKLEYLHVDLSTQITDKEKIIYKAVLKKNRYEWMLPLLQRPQELKCVATAVMNGLKKDAPEYLNYYMVRKMIDYTKLAGLKGQVHPVSTCVAILDIIHECKYSSDHGFPEKMLSMEIRETIAMAKVLRIKVSLQQPPIAKINSNEIRNYRKICKKIQMRMYCQALGGCVESIINNKHKRNYKNFSRQIY